MTSSSPRVLLTGGAGFIGSHVAEALLRRNYELCVIDNLDDFYSPAWKRANLDEVRRSGDFEFVHGDICQQDRLAAVMKEFRPDQVVHLAARPGVRPSLKDPQLYERINVGGTVNLLRLCRKTGVSRFILGSSSSVYGVSSRAPFSEDQKDLKPISPYALTKRAAEIAAEEESRKTGMSALCLRFFTVYGPRQRPDLAIHKFTAALESGLPIPVFGTGNSQRDYTWVGDIVAGIMSALSYQPRKKDAAPFEIINLGNSKPVKLNRLIELLEGFTERKAKRIPQGDQPGDVPATWANIAKAKKLLNYKPLTSIEDGLSRFVNWYRSAADHRRLSLVPSQSMVVSESTLLTTDSTV